MMLAVSAIAWSVLGLTLAASVALILKAALGLLRRSKELMASARDLSETLNRATGDVEDDLARAQDVLERIRFRRSP